MRSGPTILLASIAAAVAACSGSETLAPAPDQLGPGSEALAGNGGSHDTTDTPQNFPSVVHATGHVYVVTLTQAPDGGDTLSRAPRAGVKIEFWRNQLVNGAATSKLEGTATSDASGAYSIDIPGGYYQVRPVAGSGYNDTVELFYAGTAEASLDVYLWPKP
jgi:hypothetical protein